VRWVLGFLSIAFAAAAVAVAAGGDQAPVRAAVPKAAPPPASEVARGKNVFARMGCAGCHDLAAYEGGSEFSGNGGPNLDVELEGKTRAQLRRDIVDPMAEPEGQGADGMFGTMPTDFGQRFKPGELEALISYLLSTTRQ
jgi:mono/diheme cytochrome c family protein